MDLESTILDACEESNIEGPIPFLASVMSGVDPRKVSQIWTLVQTIEEENFGDLPTDEQWNDIVEEVEQQYKPQPVDLASSQRAAVTLAEYQHPKRKSIEMTGMGGDITLPKLDDDELDLFEVWYNDQY